MNVTMLRKKAIMKGGEKMPPRIHMSKKDVQDLVNAGHAAGNDTTELENFLNELPPDKLARNPHPVPARRLEPERGAEELVTSPEELERLRTLACPHIRKSPYWQEFISHRVLACSDCKALLPGEYSVLRQPTLF